MEILNDRNESVTKIEPKRRAGFSKQPATKVADFNLVAFAAIAVVSLIKNYNSLRIQIEHIYFTFSIIVPLIIGGITSQCFLDGEFRVPNSQMNSCVSYNLEPVCDLPNTSAFLREITIYFIAA